MKQEIALVEASSAVSTTPSGEERNAKCVDVVSRNSLSQNQYGCVCIGSCSSLYYR